MENIFRRMIRLILPLLVTIPFKLIAQAADTILVTNAHTLNYSIERDTIADGSRTNPDRWYKLERGHKYYVDGALNVKKGTHIRIIGDSVAASGTDHGPAVIMMSGYNTYNFNCFGSLTLKNLWLFYVDDNAAQSWCTMQFQTDSLHGTFDRVIFDWAQGPAITVSGKNFNGTFTNCIFRNCTNPDQWWSGRMIHFLSGSSADTVWCENNTFENMGCVYLSMGQPVHRAYFNHNTFLNVAKFVLEETYWTWVVITNNIFVNCHFAGERYSERMGHDPDTQLYGVVNVDTLLHSPTNGVTEENRYMLVANNSNYRNQQLDTFYQAYNNTVPIGAPESMILSEPFMNTRTSGFFNETYPHAQMNMSNFFEDQDPGFIVPSTNMDGILNFLRAQYLSWESIPWGFNYDINADWPLKENLAYTNSNLLTAGTDGYPLGDLNWFRGTWTSVEENRTTLPDLFALNQNYPNPFNPSTIISYQLPANSFVTLQVYDMLGRQVKTLVNERQSASVHAVVFDASNLSSGVYFYRLQTCQIRQQTGEQAFGGQVGSSTETKNLFY